MRKTTVLWVCLFLMAMTGAGHAFTEPNMADYTILPNFSSQSVPPNIMIMLDNSGSMNYNAYGTYPGDNGTVTDMPYTGEPYNAIRTFPILSPQDDAEEGVSSPYTLYYNNADLDLGGWSVSANDAIVGLRFQKVAIPQGATIVSAYIEFNANASNAETTNLLIDGEASDNAQPFSTAAPDNLKSRATTTNTVSWKNVQAWTAGQYYPSPDISAIVQEIVSRPGWSSGNSMVFRFKGTDYLGNKRDVRAYDTSSSMAPKLHVVFGGDPVYRRYYGYFSPDHFYKYNSGVFELAYKKAGYDTANSQWKAETLAGGSTVLTNADIVNNALWDGNWLNWLCMRRVDVLRKVLMGGLATARTGGGNQVNYGETPAQTNRVFHRVFNDSVGAAVSPHTGVITYEMSDGYVRVDTDNDGKNDISYSIRIRKNINYEPDSFVDGNLAGVLQRVADKARWGNSWFNAGSGSNESGATIAHTIGTNMTTMVTDLQNTAMDTWTPLAESFYVTMQYFKQEDPQSGLDYPNSAVPNDNVGDDPYYNGTQFVECAKSFAILLTDGASTMDSMIPSEYKDTDGDGDLTSCTEKSCSYPNAGSDYLDDLALYARTRDLRDDLDGDQNIILYAIHAFDRDPNATNLLMDAARNGGFDDMNGNSFPDLIEEYDRNKDGLPDTFFEADDGYAIEAKLLEAITDILKRASSGTAASVLATNSEGEGNMLQAYFLPYVTEGLEDAQWQGYLHSLWVDSYGSLYEDSNQNLQFDGNDAQISFTTDADNDTAFMRNGQTIKLNETDPNLKLKPIFEVGRRLAEKDPNTRRIFTFVDKNSDNVVDESGVGVDPFDVAGELITFDTGTSGDIKPYLGVRDDAAWGDTGAKLGTTHDQRTGNLITWVRGTDVTGLRNRTLNGVTWRLGDIIHSTPVTISRPMERFHLWYADKSYREYYDTYKSRESVVYVGSNDGMLHAFAAWKYNTALKQYQRPANASATEEIGEELWAFIPQCVLPHLKWVADADYSHTYLVDAKPRIFDAKIIPDGTHYSDGDGVDDWGTILVMGMNMGAKTISVNEDFNDGSGVVERIFNPTYICMDVSDPRNPRLLWEKSYPNQAMSQSTPIPVKVGEEWFLVFGSGPTAYDGSSNQEGYIFVVDMKTGNLLRQFGPYDSNAFFSTAASFDKNLNYNVDGIYIGSTYFASNKWKGGLYKIGVPCSNCEWDTNYDPNADFGYDTDPANWSAHKLFDSDRPISAAPSISVEAYPSLGVDNVWVYFGTGRFFNDEDKITTDQEYIYGIKDPFFNVHYKGSFQYDYAAATGKTLNRGDLFGSDSVVTTTGGVVLDSSTLNLFQGTGYFQDLVDMIRGNPADPLKPHYDGWYRLLETNGTLASERMISKPSIFGGISFFTTFTPSIDICKNDGSTNLYGVYYITGTGYIKQIFDIQTPDMVTYTINNQSVTEDVVAVKLQTKLTGAPPPSVGLHTGKEKGAKAYIQLSTGVVELLDIDSAIYMKSTITDWWDRTN